LPGNAILNDPDRPEAMHGVMNDMTRLQRRSRYSCRKRVLFLQKYGILTGDGSLRHLGRDNPAPHRTPNCGACQFHVMYRFEKGIKMSNKQTYEELEKRVLNWREFKLN
jgi:hypothetical protein